MKTNGKIDFIILVFIYFLFLFHFIIVFAEESGVLKHFEKNFQMQFELMFCM